MLGGFKHHGSKMPVPPERGVDTGGGWTRGGGGTDLQASNASRRKSGRRWVKSTIANHMNPFSDSDSTHLPLATPIGQPHSCVRQQKNLRNIFHKRQINMYVCMYVLVMEYNEFYDKKYIEYFALYPIQQKVV